jgi:hypothetical protein
MSILNPNWIMIPWGNYPRWCILEQIRTNQKDFQTPFQNESIIRHGDTKTKLSASTRPYEDTVDYPGILSVITAATSSKIGYTNSCLVALKIRSHEWTVWIVILLGASAKAEWYGITDIRSPRYSTKVQVQSEYFLYCTAQVLYSLCALLVDSRFLIFVRDFGVLVKIFFFKFRFFILFR